jgi:macrodomain Ter protein organizer (MatP/YcbG family)
MGIMPQPNDQVCFYIDAYKRGDQTEHEMAVLEERIWSSLLPEERYHVDRNQWLNQLLGTGINQLQNRSSLRNKRHADKFWERVTRKEMSVSTSLRLYKDAMRLHKRQGLSLSDAVIEILKEYDSLPNVVIRRGRPVRQSSPARLPRVEKKKKTQANSKNKKRAWDNLRRSIAELVRDKLPDGLGLDLEAQIWKEVESDVKIVLDELQGKIQRLSAKKKNEQQITKTASRRQLVAACRVLAMDPPRPGRPVDLSKAKRQKRLLAKEYHPDARDGDDSMIPQYDAVIEAYQTVEWYADQFNQNP